MGNRPEPRHRSRLIPGRLLRGRGIAFGCLAVLGVLAGAAGLQALYTRPLVTGGLPRREVYWLALSWLLLSAVLVAAGDWIRRLFSRPLPSASLGQRRLGLAATLLLLAALTTFNQFDGLLRGFHQSGDAAFGISAATELFIIPWKRDDQLRDAISSWSDFARPRQDGVADRCSSQSDMTLLFPNDCNAPLTVIVWQIGVDTAFLVPAYGVLLALLLVWGHTQLVSRSGNIQLSGGPLTGNLVIRLLRWGPRIAVAAWLVMLADWLENTVTLWSITDSWEPTTRNDGKHNLAVRIGWRVGQARPCSGS